MKIVAIAAFGAMLVAGAAGPALAETRREHSIRVSYADLEMSRASAGVVLLKRITAAATQVCGKSSNYSQLSPRGVYICRRATIASVVEEMNLATLTAAYEQRSSAELAAR